jgi:hypothetical protein
MKVNEFDYTVVAISKGKKNYHLDDPEGGHHQKNPISLDFQCCHG